MNNLEDQLMELIRASQRIQNIMDANLGLNGEEEDLAKASLCRGVIKNVRQQLSN